MTVRAAISGIARILFCMSLLIHAACSGADDQASTAEQDNTTMRHDSLDAPADKTLSTDAATDATVQAGNDESLSTLDDLLPQEFENLIKPWQGDLDGMSERRIIRVLVVSGGPLFFYYRGKPRGIVAEMLVHLQKQINADLGRNLNQVEIVPMPVSRDRLIPVLLAGSADLIAADLTITDERSALVDFSIPMARQIDEVVVFAAGRGDSVSTLDDLSGQSIYVRESSSYFEHLNELSADFVTRKLEPIDIVKANEHLRTQDILEMVNAGLIGATVVDEYKASLWSKIFTNLQVRDDLVLHKDGEIAWLFRKNSPQLAAAVNKFMQGHRSGTLIGNVLINRYFENLEWVRNSTSESAIERARPLLELFRAGGEENNIDTLMLVAQAYQESELDQDKKSLAGAVGIMQIKPSTAADRNVGIDDISTPANNIRAGARYMRFLMDRYFSDSDINELHQWLFALAAYNAGPARVRRMRTQAEAEGHDPNLWIDNVELVAARQIGSETVRYVRNVFKYYVAYRMSWEQQLLQESIDPPPAP